MEGRTGWGWDRPGTEVPPPREWVRQRRLGDLEWCERVEDGGGRDPSLRLDARAPGQMCGRERPIPDCSARARPCAVKAQPLGPTPVGAGPPEKASRFRRAADRVTYSQPVRAFLGTFSSRTSNASEGKPLNYEPRGEWTQTLTTPAQALRALSGGSSATTAPAQPESQLPAHVP